jgi:hypothetical protein
MSVRGEAVTAALESHAYHGFLAMLYFVNTYTDAGDRASDRLIPVKLMGYPHGQ